MTFFKFAQSLFCLLASCWLAACATPGQSGIKTSPNKLPDYPILFEGTPARQQALETAWRALLTEQQLADTIRYESEPVLLTPRGLPVELSGRIQLTAKTNPSLTDLELKEALRRFIEKQAVWLGVNPGDTAIGQPVLSLISLDHEANLVRVLYRQRSYLYPIAEGYGELRFTLSKTGSLLQLSSTLLPEVALPAHATIEANTLPDRFVNREFTYSNIAGQPQRYRVARADEVFVKELVVYPRIQGERLTIHLAYPVVAGKGTTWTIYLDAMTGEELGVKANFVS